MLLCLFFAGIFVRSMSSAFGNYSNTCNTVYMCINFWNEELNSACEPVSS